MLTPLETMVCYMLLIAGVLFWATWLWIHRIKPAEARRKAIAECERLVGIMTESLTKDGEPKALEYHRMISESMAEYSFNTDDFNVGGARRLAYIAWGSYSRNINQLIGSPQCPGKKELIDLMQVLAIRFYNYHLKITPEKQEEFGKTVTVSLAGRV